MKIMQFSCKKVINIHARLAGAGLRNVLPFWLLIAVFAVCGFAADWPQLQCNPQRTGYTPERPEPPYEVKWQWSPLPEDTLNSVAQPVATEKAVFLPTNKGMLYAFAAADGTVLWSAKVGMGCFHSAAFENGKVFAASMDSDVVAFDMESGRELWRTRGPGLVGFVTAPLLAEGRIYLGDMDGNMVAFEQSDGRVAWATDVGFPIVQSAAYNDGRVYVGAQDMRMRAFDAKTGAVLWTSEQLSGMSMEPYHPVVHAGYVIVRTMLLSCEVGTSIDHFIELDYDAPIEEWEKFLKERPERQDMFVLDEKTGKEAFKVPHQQARRRGGVPVSPPCVDAEGKLLITIYADVGAGWKQGTWGRLDLATRTIEPIGVAEHNRKLLQDAGVDISIFGVHDKAKGSADPAAGRLGAGGNSDETNLFSAGGRIIYFGHDIESAQAEFQGYYDLDKKQWWFMGIGSPQGRKWGGTGPGAYNGLRGFRGMGGYSHHAFAITSKRLYHHTFEVLAAWGSVSEQPVKGE